MAVIPVFIMSMFAWSINKVVFTVSALICMCFHKQMRMKGNMRRRSSTGTAGLRDYCVCCEEPQENS